MTVTLPFSGMTARRAHARPARSGRVSRLGRATASLAVAALLALPALPGSAAAAEAPTPAPSPSSSNGTNTPDGGIRFTLSPVSDGIVSPGVPLAVSLTVTNDSSLFLPSGHLVLELGDTAITDRATLESWLAGDTAGVATRQIATAASSAVAPTSAATEGVTVAPDDLALQGRAPGVYPLLARYQRPGGELVSTSAMIVPRTDGAVTPVGVVVPITAGPLTAGVLTADELTALTAPEGALTQQLEAVARTSVILAIDPAIPASIRILGDAAPASATEWLASLLALPNSRFALQYGDADVATQLAAGASSPLQPTSLLSYLSAADFPLATSSPTPEATEAPTEPDYPDLETLLDIGGARSDVFWPVSGTANGDVVETLGALGDAQHPALTLISSDSASAAGAARTARASVGKQDAGALVFDSAVSAALHEASLTDENVLRGRPLTAATALLALAAQSAGTEPLLVTVDRATDRSRVALSAAIRVTAELTTTRPASLAELADASARTVTIADAGPDESRVGEASTLLSDEGDIAAFSSILTDPQLLTGRERAELLQLLGAAWIATPQEWTLAVAEHRDATTTTLGAVSILPPSHINLWTAGASLRFWVRNELPYPVNVVLTALPDDLRLDVQRRTSIEGATASSNTRVGVPVQARLGNGDVSIELRLVSPTGVPIGSPQSAEVNVRADWEGIGVVVVLVLVGGFVGLGLVRTILRRRKARRGDTAVPDAGTSENRTDVGADSAQAPTSGEISDVRDATGDERDASEGGP